MKRLFNHLVNIATILGIIIAFAGLILLFFFPLHLTALLEYIEKIVYTLGWKNYFLVAIISMIESIPFLNVIFPGAIFIIIIGGFVAQLDYFGITAIVIVCTIIGDSLAFLLGTHKGESLLSAYGSAIGITTERLEKLKTTIKNHDYMAIFASKWTNYTRGIIPFFSGLSKTKPANFMIWNILGSIVYGTIIVLLAKIFLGNYAIVLPYLRIIAAVAIAGTGLWYLISYYVNNHKNR